MTQHVPLKVPEHFSRVDIGAYMRELRLHYGLSEQDVSERLHIRIKYVTAIEAANFDAMPGKAYARGYVHTYAEFLGLDADQIVERCFGGEAAHVVQTHAIPDSSDWYKRNKRYGGVIAVLLLLGGLFYFATHTESVGDTQTAAETSNDGVETVPEEYLARMRTMLMPNASNYDCLGEGGSLGCFYDQRLTRQYLKPESQPAMAPAPASAYPDMPHPADDVDTGKATADQPAAKEPDAVDKALAKHEAAKPELKKTDEKKPDAKKADEKKPDSKKTDDKKKADAPANYKGYYSPPKPNGQGEAKPEADSKPVPPATAQSGDDEGGEADQ